MLPLEPGNTPSKDSSQCWLGSAPASRSILSTGTCPLAAALHNGVAPKGLTAWDGWDTLAPSSNKTCTDSSAPSSTARCKWICSIFSSEGRSFLIDFDLSPPDGIVHVKLTASFQIAKLSTTTTKTCLLRGLAACADTERSMATIQKTLNLTLGGINQCHACMGWLTKYDSGIVFGLLFWTWLPSITRPSANEKGKRTKSKVWFELWTFLKCQSFKATWQG